MQTPHCRFALTLALLAMPLPALAQSYAGEQTASSSLMARALSNSAAQPPAGATTPRNDAAAAAYSMLYVPSPGPREYARHDLIQVIVRETSTARSKHELDTDKAYSADAKIKAWPHFDIMDMLQLQLQAGNTSLLPELSVESGKTFAGDGEYERRDDLTARLTAEVIEVLPNGNLVLEARTAIRNDEEALTMKMTGICRADDVSPANTVLSSQVYDLKFEKVNTGELKKANEKGVLTRIFDFFFAW